MKKYLKITLCSIAIVLCGADIKAQTLEEICEDGKGISTNPDNPVNLEATTETWRLNDFDWKIQNPTNPQNNENYFYHYDENTPNQTVINPFSGPSTSGVDYYGYITAGDASDYHPEDGWELMKVDFGKAPDGMLTGVYPALPHMMLYNKYTGTLRFFGVLRNPSPIFSVVEVKMIIPKYSPGASEDNNSLYQEKLNATNMLSIQGESIQPLDQPTSENTLSVFVNYTNNNQTFFWFDVPLAYDPCVCQFKSQFDIEFVYVKEADITLSGDITGKIETSEDLNDPTKNKAVKTFTTVLAAGISTVVAIKTGGAVINVKAYKDLVDLMASNTSNTNIKASLETLSTAIGCGGQQLVDIMAGNYGKWEGNFGSLSEKDQIKRVVNAKKIVESSTKFFSSVEKGCGDGKSTSKTVITGRVEASGSVITRTIIQGDKIHMGVPGSKWDIELTERSSTLTQDYNKLVPAYPMYNERVGTFALLNTPELFVRRFSNSCTDANDDFNIHMNRSTWSMRLNSNINYTFNPLLNLDPDKTTILTRFVISSDAEQFQSGDTINGRSMCTISSNFKSNTINVERLLNSEYRMITPFIPIDYIRYMPMRFAWMKSQITTNTSLPFPEELNSFTDFEDKMFIQFKIIAESNDLDKDGNKNTIFQVLTFPVKFNNISSDPNGSIVTGNYVQDVKDFDTDEVFTSNTDLFFEGPVFISADLSTSNGAKLRIYSLNGFILEPGAELSPQIELIVGSHLPRIEQPEATYSQLDAFCNNAESSYRAKEFSTTAYREMVEETDRYNEELMLKELEKEKAQKLNLSLYPNPTDGVYTVDFDYALQNILVTVLDIYGKVVYTQNFAGENARVTLDATQLEAGVYFIDVRDANGKIGRQRLVKY